MSDSGRGRGGHGERGDCRSSGRGGKSSPSTATEERLSDCVCCLGSARQALGCEATTEHLADCIGGDSESGDNVGSSLEKLGELDVSAHKPVLLTSAETDAAARDAQDRQCEIESKAESDKHMKREQTHEDDTSKSCASLRGQCAKSVQDKTQARGDSESGVGGSPIALLGAARQRALDCQGHRHGVSVILDAIKTMINLTLPALVAQLSRPCDGPWPWDSGRVETSH